MKTLLYLVGEPGVGKTTTVDALVKGYRQTEVYDAVVPHILYGDQDGYVLAQIGKKRDKFSGTDALPMNIIESTPQFFQNYPYPKIVAEGARLANKRFLQLALDAGYKVVLVALQGEIEALERRSARGSKQAESWVRGRRTATRNLTENPPNNVLVEVIKASLSPAERANILRTLLEM